MIVKHLIAKLERCRKDLLNHKNFLHNLLLDAAGQSDMTPLKTVSHRFNPHGVSMVILLKESHIAVHTWPERAVMDLEIVTCGKKSDPKKGFEIIKDKLGSKRSKVKEVVFKI